MNECSEICRKDPGRRNSKRKVNQAYCVNETSETSEPEAQSEKKGRI